MHVIALLVLLCGSDMWQKYQTYMHVTVLSNVDIVVYTRLLCS